MGRPTRERKRGTFAWRLDQLRIQWGLGVGDLRLIYGEKERGRITEGLLDDGIFEGYTEVSKQKHIARLKAALPEIHMEYLLNGGEADPPPDPDDFFPEVIMERNRKRLEMQQRMLEQDEFVEVFREITKSDARPKVRDADKGDQVLFSDLIRRFMDEFSLPFQDATRLALVEMVNLGKKEAVDFYMDVIGGPSPERAGETPVGYGEARIVPPRQEGIAEGRQGEIEAEKKVANGGG